MEKLFNFCKIRHVHIDKYLHDCQARGHFILNTSDLQYHKIATIDSSDIDKLMYNVYAASKEFDASCYFKV